MVASRIVFDCIDGHTCGNPVRLVTSSHPPLNGDSMSARRLDFIENHDWIRTALMFEPRGHDMMSGSFLYPAIREDCDIAVLYIETSGCLPMCGHGTIGTVTFALEEKLVNPEKEGLLRLDTPAGRVDAEYQWKGDMISQVRIHNVASFLAATDVVIEVPSLGEIHLDVAYGGNFYAIIEPQKHYSGLNNFSASDIIRFSPIIRNLVNKAVDLVHPEDPNIKGCRHVLWADAPTAKNAHGKCAVFYGEKAIDRSPCGTGTSARMAQLAAKGQLSVGDEFNHESIIGSIFEGRVESACKVGNMAAIKPSIAGWARITGYNRIIVDPRDPFALGFTVQ